MVSFKDPRPVCTERDFLPSWLDASTINPQLTPTQGPLSHESRHNAKKHQKPKKHRQSQHKPVPADAVGYLEEVKGFEGIVPHMYRDSKGYMTVGIGFLIENTGTHEITDAALKMPFVNRVTHKSATEDEIKVEFDTVKSQPYLSKAGHALAASSFTTTLDLDATYINTRFAELVDQFWKQLESEFGSDFDKKYPLGVQYALLDMIFNMGRGTDIFKKGKIVKRTGLHQFLQLRKALDGGDWKKAGEVSHRNGIGTSRNARIKEWFENAVPKPSILPIVPPDTFS